MADNNIKMEELDPEVKDIITRQFDMLSSLRQRKVDDSLVEDYTKLPYDVAMTTAASNITEASFILKELNPELAGFLYQSAEVLWDELRKYLDTNSYWEENVAGNEELKALYEEMMQTPKAEDDTKEG